MAHFTWINPHLTTIAKDLNFYKRECRISKFFSYIKMTAIQNKYIEMSGDYKKRVSALPSCFNSTTIM